MTTPAQAPPAYQTFKRQVKLAPNQHLAFAAGKGYSAAPGAPSAPAAPPPADPYAAIIAGAAKPSTGAQITKAAQGEISPLLAAVTKTIGGQTAAATNAIGGFTGDAAAKLAAIDFGAPYAGAEQGQAAVDAALRAELAGAGSTGADQLAQRLAVINDPSVGAAAGALTANGAANATTQVAQGSASLGELLANAAAAKDYGLKQPGITRLAGLNAIAAAGQQGQAQIAAQAHALEAQLPSIIQNLQAQSDQRAQYLTAAHENQLARNDKIAYDQSVGQATAADHAATLNERAGATTQTNQTHLQIAQMNAQGKASAAQATQARSDRAYRLQFSKTFGYDPVTGNTLPGYTRNADGTVRKAGTNANGAKTPQLSASQVQKYKGTAATIADNAQAGFTDPKSVVHPAISAADALKEMRQEGIPDAIAIPAINRAYGTKFNPKGKLP